ncbi:hypothetical protein [Paenibacillus taichungensis]|uniref:hypothetical protein n=1 Tax=Paenibacillus taichungensis TaxID=484184 RepID=UPI0015C5AF0E|nr:hypothetical protein [Paenibacillus taichungensis]
MKSVNSANIIFNQRAPNGALVCQIDFGEQFQQTTPLADIRPWSGIRRTLSMR